MILEIFYYTKKNHGNILIYDISHKTFMGSEWLCIKFSKIDGFIKVYDGIRYIEIFDYEEQDEIHKD